MTLAQTQREFTARLRNDRAVLNVRGDAGFRRGFAVYHHAYRAALRESLRASFEQTHTWLGDDRFEEAMAAHIAAKSPSSFTISAFGEDFDVTLAHLYRRNPEVAELAALEWALARAFDGPDSPPLGLSLAEPRDWEQARFTLVPTLAMQPVTTNCAPIWTALSQGEVPPKAEVMGGGHWLAVWRDDLTSRFRVIDALERGAIRMAGEGESFGRICEWVTIVAGDDADAATIAGSMLHVWISDGLIASVAGGTQSLV